MTALYSFAWPAIESFQTLGGVTYRIADGNVYSWPANVLLSSLYDPAYIETVYRQDDAGNYYLYNSLTGASAPVYRNLTDDFSSYNETFDAVRFDRPIWNSMTNQSTHYETPGEYASLRNKIFSGTSDFLESRLDLVPSLTPNTDWPLNCASNRAGECCVIPDSSAPKMMRFYSPPPALRSFLTKSSIDTENLFAKKGDAIRITGMFYRASGLITAIMDLESSYITGGPGVRILFNSNSEARMELKWGDKPTYLQTGTPVTFPLGVWTKFSMYFELDDTSAGVAQLEIDDVLVINGTGQTLAVPDQVCNRLELGITSTSDPNGAVLYAKDISVVTT